jgi:hypothetical protein
MKRSAAVIVLGSLVTISAVADDAQDRAAKSREAIKEFAGGLQNALQSAMKEGGPVKAIEACNKVAPGIAADISKKNNWDVGRTSLKVRNTGNAPDAWENAVLEKFEQRKAAGEDPAKIEHFEVVTEGGKKQFRYMKAIPTAEVCTKCHGTEIDPAVGAKLKELYPNDQATGFKVGDLRGAFSIVQPM